AVEVIAPSVHPNASQLDAAPPPSSRNSAARTYLAVMPPSVDVPVSSSLSGVPSGVPSSSRNTPTSPDTPAPVSLTIDTAFGPTPAPSDREANAFSHAATAARSATTTQPESLGPANQSRIAKVVLGITSLLGVGLLVFT